MSKSRELFEAVQEVKVQLADLSIQQLRSLLPATTWFQNHAIRELIKEKSYDTEGNY